MNSSNSDAVKWSESKNKEKLNNLIAEGASLPQIAKTFGISQRATYSAVYRHTKGLRRVRCENKLPLTIK